MESLVVGLGWHWMDGASNTISEDRVIYIADRYVAPPLTAPTIRTSAFYHLNDCLWTINSTCTEHSIKWCVSLIASPANGYCAIARWLWLMAPRSVFGLFADLAVARDGARGRWLGHFVALSGQARSVPVQVAASLVGGCSYNDAYESDDEWHWIAQSASVLREVSTKWTAI